MENLKLVSVRIEPKSLEASQEWCSHSEYRKQSDVIRSAVDLAAWMIQNGYGLSLCKFYPQYGDVVDHFDFQYHRQHR